MSPVTSLHVESRTTNSIRVFDSVLVYVSVSLLRPVTDVFPEVSCESATSSGNLLFYHLYFFTTPSMIHLSVLCRY